MKGELRINENQITWIPKCIYNAGFEGKIQFLMNTSVVVLCHPMADIETIEKGLEIILSDVRLRKLLKEEADIHG